MAVKIDTNFNEETNQTEMRLDGEIDIYGSELFKEKIHELAKKHPDKDMYIDMTNLEYIDSTGLGVLIGALKILKGNGKNISLHHLKPNVYKIFKITNLTQIFNVAGME